MKKYTIFLLLFTLFCISLHGDVIYLKNGKKVEGQIVKQSGGKVYIKSQGMTFSLNKYEIDRIEIKKTSFQVYKDALKKLDPANADAQYKMGNWCGKNELPAYAKEHWKKAIEINPDHEGARKGLGFEKYEGEWLTHAAVMTKKGFVQFEKKWVTPEIRDTILWDRAVQKYLPKVTSKDPKKRETAVSGLLAFKAKGGNLLLEKLLPLKQELLAQYRKDIVPVINNALTSFQETRKKLSESQTKTLAAIGKPEMCEQELSNIELHKKYREKFKAIDTAFKGGELIRNDLYMLEDTILRSRKEVGTDKGTPLEKDLMQGINEAGIALFKKEDIRMKRDARIMAYNAQLEFPNDNEETAARLYNEYRILVGRLPFVVEKCITMAARGHSAEMTELGYFAHVSPTPKNKTYVMRVKNAGYDGSACGENCAGYPTALRAVAGWLHSAPHHKNLSQKRANELGMGYAGKYTANFGYSKKDRIPADFKADTDRPTISYEYYIAVWNNPKKKK